MSLYQLKDVQLVSTLRDMYGHEVLLIGEDAENTIFQIVTEFVLHEKQYAILQSAKMRNKEEISAFYVVTNGDQTEITTIEDDDEWENVMELYDEMMFSDEI